MEIKKICTTKNKTPIGAAQELPGRCRRIGGPLLLAAAMGLLVALPLLAAELQGRPINLSKRAAIQIKSADPHVAASSDGQYAAAVWSRGYNAESTTKAFGRVVFKSATADGWEDQVNVYTPATEESAWATQPRLDFDANDSGRVHIVWVECQNQTSDCSRVMAATCALTDTDTCDDPVEVYSDADTGAALSAPSIASDSSGRLHTVWSKQAGSANLGIWYGRIGGATPGKIGGTDADSVNPSLAWTSGDSGRLHLTWFEKDNATPSNRRIKYVSSNDDGTWSNLNADEWKLYGTGPSAMPDLKPSLAATGTLVYVAWDAAKDASGDWVLAFDWSDGNGNLFQDSYYDISSGNCGAAGDGCGIPNATLFDAVTYDSPFSSISEEDALRPSIAIAGQAPAIAWHHKDIPPGSENSAYMIGYRDSISSGGTIVWNEGLTITNYIDYDTDDGNSWDDSANPQLALWPGKQVHLVHMGMWGGNPSDPDSDWDIYYRGVISTDLSTDDIAGTFLPVLLRD